jgi:hypothetical protein
MDGMVVIKMPDKHFYFSIGAVAGSGVSFLIGINRHSIQKNYLIFREIHRKNRHWFLYFPIIIFTFGLWGLIPDVIHASGILSKEQTRGEIFNIFFFHSFFEYIEDSNEGYDQILNWIGEFIILAISIGVMVFYINQIKKHVRNIKTNNHKNTVIVLLHKNLK